MTKTEQYWERLKSMHVYYYYDSYFGDIYNTLKIQVIIQPLKHSNRAVVLDAALIHRCLPTVRKRARPAKIKR